MPNYQEGKIYKVFNNINNDFYIGSTTQKLSYRMKDHRADCKRRAHLPLYKAMIEYGTEHFYIELVEKYPCNDKEELDRKEGEYIRNLKPAMNQFIPGRSRAIYYHENIERFKQYYQDNKDKIKEYNKQYSKQYYEQNKEKINQQLVECECGCVILKNHFAKHKQTKKHKQLLTA